MVIPLYIYVAGAKLSTRQPASAKAANRRSLVVLDTGCNANICQVNPVILMKTLKVHSSNPYLAEITASNNKENALLQFGQKTFNLFSTILS